MYTLRFESIGLPLPLIPVVIDWTESAYTSFAMLESSLPTAIRGVMRWRLTYRTRAEETAGGGAYSSSV